MRMIELGTQAPKLLCIVLNIAGPPSPVLNTSISGQGFSKAGRAASGVRQQRVREGVVKGVRERHRGQGLV